MVCSSCGREIAGEPVMAVYGDEAFAHKRVHAGAELAFPLDRECFERDRVLTVTRWVNGEDGEPVEPVLEEFETTRYIEVQ